MPNLIALTSIMKYIIIIIFLIFIFFKYFIQNIFNFIEYDWLSMVNENITFSVTKCNKFNKKYLTNYIDFSNTYANSKYYKFSTLKLFPVISYTYYCYPNKTCIKKTLNITDTVQPVLLLTHNLYSTKSNIIQNCDLNIFKGQCEDSYYYDKYIPTKNVNISHIQYAVFFAGWHTDAVYHGLIDSLSRIVLFYNFLINHKQIYIHISPPRYKQDEIRFILNLLGFSNDRIINANYIYVDNLYIPFPFYCGVPSSYIIYNFNKLLRSKVKRAYDLKIKKFKSIIVLQRMRNRIIKNFYKIVYMLKQVYPNHCIIIYRDNNTNLKEIITMFYYADVVIGEYGAGLSNVLFCKEGVIVFEISLSHFREDYPKITTQINSKHYVYYTNTSTQYVKYFYVNETDFLHFIKRFY